MAISKIIAVKESKGQDPAYSLKKVIDYILNPEKTRDGKLTCGWNTTPDSALDDFIWTKEVYDKEDKRQGYHLIISFNPEEVTADTAFRFMEEFAEAYLTDKYQGVYAIHEDKKHIHGHLVFNSVNQLTGRKFRYERGDWNRYIQPTVNAICRKYGLEVLPENEPGVSRKKSYNEWLDNSVRFTIEERKEVLRAIIDDKIQEVSTLEELKEVLQEEGIIVRGKTMSLRLPNVEKGIRVHQLGYAYTPENLVKRIAGETVELPTLPELSGDSMASERPRMQRVGMREKGKRSYYKNSYYKYKDDIARFQVNQRLQNYLMEKHIDSDVKLTEQAKELRATGEEIDRQRRALFAKRKELQQAIYTVRNLDALEAEEQLRKLGLNREDIIEFDKTTEEQLTQLRYQKRAVLREESMIETIRERILPAAER